MKNIKLTLDIEEETLQIGLVRLVRQMPDYEFFFKVNQCNAFKFSRIENFEMQQNGSMYQFGRYQTHDTVTKSTYTFIANKSHSAKPLAEFNDLFSHLYEPMQILPKYSEVDYILLTKEFFNDFSVILLPEKLTFPIQEVTLSPEHQFYQILQYYE